MRGTLLRLAAAVAAGCTVAAAAGLSPSAPRFEAVADASGLGFVHDNGARGEFWLPEIMGAGVAVFDYDNDGWEDVFATCYDRSLGDVVKGLIGR